MRILVIFVLNVLSRRILNMLRLNGWDRRGNRRVRSRLGKDDTIIFWIKL